MIFLQSNSDNPLLNFLSNDNIGRLTQMATEIVASAAKHSAVANINALYAFLLIKSIFDSQLLPFQSIRYDFAIDKFGRINNIWYY